MQQAVRYGIVSGTDPAKATVCVAYPGGGVSPPLPMLSHTYRMPAVGDGVLCVYFYRGAGGDRCDGFCLGGYYDDARPPFTDDPNVIGFDFFGEANLQYNRSTQTMTVKAKSVTIDSKSVMIDGNLTVTGNITSDAGA